NLLSRAAWPNVILANLVEQCFVADVQHSSCPLAVPAMLFKSVGNRFHLSAVFQGLYHLLEIWILGLGASHRLRTCLLGRSALQFSNRRVLIAQPEIAFDKILQLPDVARPGIPFASLDQPRRNGEKRASIALG